MDQEQKLGTFMINVNQDHLQDVFDIEDCLDQIMEVVLDEEINCPDMWIALQLMRERLDDMRERTLVTPQYVREVTDTHQPILTNKK